MVHYTLLIPLAAFLFSLFGTRVMIALSILDNPEGERSSHHTPTPTSGGVVVIAAFMFFLVLIEVPIPPAVLIILCGAGILATIGFIDEFKEISFKIRLVIQLLVSIVVLMLTIKPGFTFGSILYFCALLTLLGGFINAFNFIDGLNGMSGSAALVGAFFAGLYFHNLAIFYFALIPALLGFLFFNVKGKIFIGDVGSVFLGFLFPTLLLLEPHQLQTSILVLGHLFFLYLSDVSLTIIRRLKSGLTIVHPHRDFFFLRLHRAGLSHLQVSTLFAGCTVLQGILLFLIPLNTKVDFLQLYLFDSLFYGLVLYAINYYFCRKVPV